MQRLLRKDTLDTELFKALRTLAEGRRYLAENDANSLLDSLMYIPPKKKAYLHVKKRF